MDGKELKITPNSDEQSILQKVRTGAALSAFNFVGLSIATASRLQSEGNLDVIQYLEILCASGHASIDS